MLKMVDGVMKKARVYTATPIKEVYTANDYIPRVGNMLLNIDSTYLSTQEPSPYPYIQDDGYNRGHKPRKGGNPVATLNGSGLTLYASENPPRLKINRTASDVDYSINYAIEDEYSMFADFKVESPTYNWKGIFCLSQDHSVRIEYTTSGKWSMYTKEGSPSTPGYSLISSAEGIAVTNRSKILVRARFDGTDTRFKIHFKDHNDNVTTYETAYRINMITGGYYYNRKGREGTDGAGHLNLYKHRMWNVYLTDEEATKMMEVV